MILTLRIRNLNLLKKIIQINYKLRKNFCTKNVNDKIRNIGIVAHIDAGKTTTTERMLFYSGKTSSLGEVHHGNTITDYLTQERERGITICSSAVTFPWKNFRINLLDTPGHIDFTMEVEQSLHAVDGVVVVLDGSAGVEAQTLTVWSQCNKHHLPKIVFINKMDRKDSNLLECIKDVQNKFNVEPMLLQLPIKEKSGLVGIIDIIELNKIIWDQKTLGRHFIKQPLNGDILKELTDKRKCLIDRLSNFDDELAEAVIVNESFEKITNDLIWNAVRKATCQQNIVPMMIGSAYKNIGIQLLMDAITKYLPAPNERNQFYDCFGTNFAGKVFKIVHDSQKGVLTLIRVFRGELKKGGRISTAKGTTEIVQKLYEPLADEYREISIVKCGDIAVCGGLKSTVTGDLLVASRTALKNAQNKMTEKMDKNRKTITDLDDVFILNPEIPDAVYFCSIEPPSLAYQNSLDAALKQLQREDPSLRVKYDEITGQTVLGGMGELHMDVVKSRILTEYKIDAELGPLQIAYKETLETDMKLNYVIEKQIAGTKQSVEITFLLQKEGKEIFTLDNSPENSENLSSIRIKTLQIIKKGALGALERGPKVGGQIVDCKIKLCNVKIGKSTADSFLMAASAQCVQKILMKAGTRLLEPIMALQIIVPTDRVSVVLGDLARRRSIIDDIIPKGEGNRLINVKAPLAELSGYSSVLRTISSGQAIMTMQPNGYFVMNCDDEIIAIKRSQGLE